MKRINILTTLLLICTINGFAQQLTQNIGGQILDKQSQQPLIGVTVYVVGTQPILGTVSNEKGYYKIKNVPVGRVNIAVSYLGYQNSGANNLILTTGKELIVNFELEEKITETGEVVVTSTRSKSKALNEMATVSARTFTIEETEKYAGSRGDVARMASNFAGVSFANDSRNDIVIRGNSPSGLLWKLDDIEIPNPNHFAENGTTGGPVGMLNNNVLRNSDFFTGAFPAEYGNAMSGVFDLKMRNGNTDKYEFLFQSGFNGFELGAEGPIQKSNNSSFLINYRYSTLELFDKMGVNFGTSGVPKYQDLSFKFNYPVNKGVVTLFGLSGMSRIDMLTSNLKDNKDNFYLSSGEDLYNSSSMAAAGITYTRFISSSTYAKIAFSGLAQKGGTDIDTLEIKPIINITTNDTIDYFYNKPYPFLRHNIAEYRSTAAFTLATKFDAQLNTKAGFSIDFMGYNLNTKLAVDSINRKRTKEQGDTLVDILNGSKSLTNGPQLFRSYYEASFKINEKVTINPGIHFVYFSLSKQALVEPRFGLTWQYANNKKINLGYGMHSRTHALSTYYMATFKEDHSLDQTNIDLKATLSHQFVIGHDWNISDNLRLKAEAYYQYLYNVPVEQNSSTFSLLNTGAGWGVEADDSLVNKGKGYNSGVEITFEKFLSKGYYFLLTTSLFDSKYRGSDGVLRNTAFNGNFVVNALVGKEFTISEKSTLNFDIKVAYAGGKRSVPIVLEASTKKNDAVYDYSRAYEKRASDFFKVDFKVGYRINGKRTSQEWQVYIENITNHRNLLNESFNKRKLFEKPEDIAKHEYIDKTYQLGFFPMVNYRLNF
jgi:hypothetical protein